MKKIVPAILLCLCWVLGATAQNSVESIRKEYNGVKEWIALMSDEFPADGIPPEYYELNVRQNLPGSGPHREITRFYWDELPREEEGDPYPPHFLRFATHEFNFAAREFYEEYLFDDNGHLLFIYALTPDVNPLDMQPVYELRMWFAPQDRGAHHDDSLILFSAKKAETLDYIDLESLRKASFSDEYSGASIPEKFQNETNRLLEQAQWFLKLFSILD